MSLADLVRKLRGEAFEPERSHERQWETEEQENAREKRNQERRAAWDAATERMIARASDGETEITKELSAADTDCDRLVVDWGKDAG